jgi:hypothetical protein
MVGWLKKFMGLLCQSRLYEKMVDLAMHYIASIRLESSTHGQKEILSRARLELAALGFLL